MRDARETHGIWLYATPDQIQGRHAPAVKNVRAETGPRDRAVLKSFFMLSSFLSPFSQAKFHSALCRTRRTRADRLERASQTGGEESLRFEPWLSSCRAVEAPSSRCRGAVKALPVEPVE